MPELEDISEREEEDDELEEVYVENAKLDKEEEEEQCHVLSVESSDSLDAGGSTISNTVHALDNNVELEQLKEDSAIAGPPAVPPRKMYEDDVQVVLEMKM
ncbi:hypothetical protein EJB05_43139, partial [Eragrostis curvula]